MSVVRAFYSAFKIIIYFILAINKIKRIKGGGVPGITENTGVHGELIDLHGGLGLHARRLRVLCTHSTTRWHEKRSIYHYVSFRPPIPTTPLFIICLHALRHLKKKTISIAFSFHAPPTRVKLNTKTSTYSLQT